MDGRPIKGINYAWRPSSALAAYLPADFSFPLRCVSCPDGLRRFYPSSFEGMIARGFTGGLAILSVLFNFTEAQRSAYGAMYLFFERLRRSREHLGNRLLNSTSLRIARAGRDIAEERDILPASLGQNAKGEGDPWSLETLLREGRVAASGAGIARPTEEDCVHYGLVAAARLNPSYVRDQEVLPLVRMALYESIPWDEKEIRKPTVLRYVIQRALTAVQEPEHLEEPAAAFTTWFAGPKNSFVQQIARRKLRLGGILDLRLVRWALQELGWQAYSHLAGCIHAQMWLFRRLFPAPLSADELRWFEQMLCPQPCFGNLPLVLLVERFPFLHSVLWEIWENPGEPEPIAVLHRLLAYYAEMASTRRNIDRRVQQRRDDMRLGGGRVPLIGPLPPESADDDSDEAGPDEAGGEDDMNRTVEGKPISSAARSGTWPREFVAALAALVRKQKQVRCPCATPFWDDQLICQDEVSATFKHFCTNCRFAVESTASLEELTPLAANALPQ